jgi:lipopolysaccharide biosynthesis glycosyltransferase
VTIGGSLEYISLLDIFLKSALFSNLENIDILILCEKDYWPKIKKTIDFIELTHHPINTPIIKKESKQVLVGNDSVYLDYQNMAYSIQKLLIYTYPDLSNYEKVLYIDIDSVICKNINHLFDKITDKKCLHICSDTKDFSKHNLLYYGSGNYSQEILDKYQKNNILPFSGGIFGMIPSELMSYHFKTIFNLILKCEQDFFYEQSHMNHYFNKHGLVKDVYGELIVTPLSEYPSNSKTPHVLHYASTHVPVSEKHKFLKNFYDNNIKST